ncbi:Spy/CpxP family protein refolding chaperone [Iodobacter ciconiae]|uniref:Periplasmic heavy metal sensor n=1 Tax=Iodobacter ciconiae TaxID=2496266 RepID=A0A3S8ZNG5_9NEIS|nr:Spy/CpxP family protein refolding chaperone [Iodobacter ciconiae]AZN35078.1 periplasmic heavy metal sensor [Iodobacter ciconiae]
MFNALKTKFQHHHMKRRAAIIAVMGLSLGGIAYAAAPGHCGDGPGMRRGNPEQMHKMMQSRLDKALQEVGATDAQKVQLNQLAEQASKEMKAQHETMRNNHDELRKALSQTTVDAAQLETLRAAKIKTMDESSRKLTAILAEASKILTPEQRLKLIEKMDRKGRNRG